MELKRLEVFGFKSFADRTRFDFDSGITVVVGPNGCGKSNVVDAVKWVLGEQSPKSLRGREMADVIFAGSESRRSLGFAEATLTFDNSSGTLPVDVPEVEVSRRLYRSGESEYLLNRKPCRLRDIRELFMDTGVGVDAYSLIEQGKVDVLLQSNPHERRLIFEEAAGISKYKAKRREALRKLETTRGNLLRVGDIIEEVEKQVRGLRRQAAKAQRHQRYSQELKEHEIGAAGKDYWRREEEGNRLRQMLKEAQVLTDRVGEQLSTKETQAQKLRHRLGEQEQSLARIRSQLSERGEHIHKLEEQILVSQERKDGLRQQRDRIQADVQRLNSKREDLLQQGKDRAGEAAKVAEQLSRAQELFVQKEKRLAVLDGDLYHKRTAVEQSRRRISDLLLGKNDLGGELQRLRAQLETNQRREQMLTEEMAKISGETDQFNRSLSESDDKLKKACQNVQELEAQLEKAQEKQKRLLASLRKVVDQERDLEGQVKIRKNRLELLQGVLKSYEGYHQGVKSLLTDLSDLPGVCGTVADILQVSPKYVPAVEAALGEASQYILVETTDTALKAMEHLHRRKAGRATFLILDWARRLNAASKPQKALNRKGALAWAADVITCDQKYRPAVDLLLGGVVIVDDVAPLASAVNQSLEQQIIWVSPSGDVLETPALIRGGHLLKETGLLDRRRKTLQEKEDLDSLATALQERHARRLALESDEKQHAGKVNELQRTLQTRSLQKTQVEKETETLRLQSKALSDRRDALTRELEGLRGQDRPHNKLMAQLTEKLSRLEDQLAGEREGGQLLEEQFRDLESTSRTTLKDVNEDRVQLVSLQGRCEQLRLDTERLKQIEQELQSNMESQRAEIEGIEKKSKDLTAQIAAMGQEVQERGVQKSEFKARGKRLAEDESSARMELQGLESEIKEVREQRESGQNQVHDRQLQLTEIEAKQQATMERIQQEYQLDLRETENLEEEEELNLQEREKHIRFLRQKIQTMGPVNLAALEEYKIQKERYDFLVGQRDDLLRAEQNLNRVIQEMNKRARRLFGRTFKKVNEAFQTIFSQMFDGGEANLILNGKEDPLEANIEIYACPGGKRLRHIAQLSGGEKALTAISLLFSLYQVKPSPFCVLDEVDAPLDDVNIGRFVEILRKLSQKSQFIIITHNKNTMAAANVLYGVTMEQSGASRVVSVNLRQTDKSAAQ
ncbi:chromosome segregation protein SMC [bacterium]|nr:chromosome segregation protein SMC [bacterium]